MGLMEYLTMMRDNARGLMAEMDRKAYDASRYYLGPHMTNAISNAGQVVQNFSDVTDYRDAIDASRGLMGSLGQRDPWGAAANTAGLAAAAGAMLLPGLSVGWVDNVARAADTGGAARAAAKADDTEDYIRAYHGSPHDFDKFDLDEGGGVAWFTDSETHAKQFGKDRMGLAGPQSSYFDASKYREATPRLYEVSLDNSKLMDVDVFGEARKVADDIGAPSPQTDIEALDVLNWAAAQDGYIDEARNMGFSGVKFTNLADNPDQLSSTHYAIFRDDIIEILRKYGLIPAAMTGGGLMAQSNDPTLRDN